MKTEGVVTRYVLSMDMKENENNGGNRGTEVDRRRDAIVEDSHAKRSIPSLSRTGAEQRVTRGSVPIASREGKIVEATCVSTPFRSWQVGDESPPTDSLGRRPATWRPCTTPPVETSIWTCWTPLKSTLLRRESLATDLESAAPLLAEPFTRSTAAGTSPALSAASSRLRRRTGRRQRPPARRAGGVGESLSGRRRDPALGVLGPGRTRSSRLGAQPQDAPVAAAGRPSAGAEASPGPEGSPQPPEGQGEQGTPAARPGPSQGPAQPPDGGQDQTAAADRHPGGPPGHLALAPKATRPPSSHGAQTPAPWTKGLSLSERG
nr:uncharacterized protein LOC113801335 [Penaeus vannamei]